MASSVRDLLRVPPGTAVPFLTSRDPAATPGGVADKKAAAAALAGLKERLHELQERLYAEGTRSLLLVLQGMDTSGKGGTIEHVAGAMNPQGIRLASFGKPTEEELAHHYLWRVERALPGPGWIGIFDRSHYEDVLIVRVHGLVPPEVWQSRYAEIAEWERSLAAAGTTLVKCMLHISYDEQRERLLARLDHPDKRWKFREGDVDERRRWPDYQAAYDDAVTRCATPENPWYVVPADRKWYRNWAVASILVETLEEMDPRYPRPDLDVERLRARLAPPG